MPAIQRTSALVADLMRRGIRLSIEDGRLIARPGRLLTPEVRRNLAANIAAIAALVRRRSPLPADPTKAPTVAAADWRAHLDAWPPARRARWCAKAAVLKVLDRLPAEEADRSAFEALAAESDGPEWIIAGGDGRMRLMVRSEPPWPVEVLEAASIVEVIDRHHRVGEDALAVAAASKLEEKLADLRAQGISARPGELTGWLGVGRSEHARLRCRSYVQFPDWAEQTIAKRSINR